MTSIVKKNAIISSVDTNTWDVRGFKEEGTITTAFDLTVLNDMDRFQLVMDVIDRLPQTVSEGTYLKRKLQDKLIEHKHYINSNGADMPEILN